MAAMSRGKVERPFRVTKKRIKTTETTKRHRFESFSQRIAKLKIDPVHRVRQCDIDAEQDVPTSSYFHSSLDEWRDLNLSENFTAFTRRVQNLCESLPQILHYQDDIMGLLVEYIGKHDSLSLEPLLDLTAHFAHDLGVRFEKHFALAVATITQVAAKHPDVEAIEWSFTCLAWLFKYLSKLLTPDLRPLYDLISPLLGKEHQRAFITRFAAESFSFLLRKAGATYHRDPEPLNVIIQHIYQDLSEEINEKQAGQYSQGLQTLFAETMQGVQRGLHSSAAAVFRAALTHMPLDQSLGAQNTMALHHEVVERALISTIHHTDAEHLRPLITIATEHITSMLSAPTYPGIYVSARLMLVLAGVRKGSRIEDWTLLLRAMSCVVDSALEIAIDDELEMIIATTVLSALAVVLHSAPFDAVIPYVRLVQQVSRSPWDRYFLSFCITVAKLDRRRFENLALRQMQSYITQQWQRQGTAICLTLSAVKELGVVQDISSQLPAPWIEHMRSDFSSLLGDNIESETEAVSRCNAYLQFLEVNDPSSDTLTSDLATLIAKVLKPSVEEPLSKELSQFALGNGFKYLVRHNQKILLSRGLWETICCASGHYGRLVAYWEAILTCLKSQDATFDVKGSHAEPLTSALLEALSAPSAELRTVSLDVLNAIHLLKYGNEREILNVAVLIVSMPVNLETARTLSMHIRKLTALYTVETDTLLLDAMPRLLFGLFWVKFSQVWSDAAAALREMTATKHGEEVVSRIAFSWLHVPVPVNTQEAHSERLENSAESVGSVSQYECTNLTSILKLSSEAVALLDDPLAHLHQRLLDQHRPIEQYTPSCRAHALRVLTGIPDIAEKRSRTLVPVLLEWALHEHAPATDSEDSEIISEGSYGICRWNRKDQKALLSIFAQFVNPRVLFKSAEVRTALDTLLCNGDVDIQRTALKAVLTWKDPAINRYQENLLNILDDARFREEIAVFLDVGTEDATLQDGDREQLLPVILRLLFGKVTARSGSVGGRRGEEARRKAVFIALSRFGESAIEQFLSIALGPLRHVKPLQNGMVDEEAIYTVDLSPRKRFAVLNLLEDLLDTLGTQLLSFTGRMANAVLYCLLSANRELATILDDRSTDAREGKQLSLLRSVRQLGLRCLNQLFISCSGFDWTPYMAPVYSLVIRPRLKDLPIETAQSVSGILRLISTWCSSLHYAVFLSTHATEVVEKLLECLQVASAKDEVKLFVLRDVFGKAIELVSANDQRQTQQREVAQKLLTDNADIVLSHIGRLLRGSPSRDVLEAAIEVVSRFAEFISGTSETEQFIEISVFLLNQPTKRVIPSTKSAIVRILLRLVPMCDTRSESLFGTVFDTVAELSGFFQDQPSRRYICQILDELAQKDASLRRVSALSEDLNALEANRLNEPDYERRSAVLSSIRDDNFQSFTAREWKLIVHNLLYFVKDPSTEPWFRSDASSALQRLIAVASEQHDGVDEELKSLIANVLLPAIHTGARAPSELVRAEFLNLLAHIIKHFSNWEAVSDMRPLLKEDEEESFFVNVLHIQQNRRSKALRQLATVAENGQLTGGNIGHFFIPLVEHFVFDRVDDDGANNVAGDAIKTIGSLAEWMEWPQYRAVLRRYVGYVSSRPDMIKVVVRLLSSIIDALSRAGRRRTRPLDSTDGTNVNDMQALASGDKPVSGKLPSTMPSSERLAKDLTENVLPALNAYLHNKDETTVSLRVPVAVAVTKLLQLLPTEDFAARLPAVLIDVCHILRSRAVEARDMARRTLAEIAALVGPIYFNFIIKELRSALHSGYQVHVLSYTLHSLLLSTSTQFEAGDLDYCVADIVDVIMDDIFGLRGQEKDAEGYTNKMKEVKASKSYDSMEILARITTVQRLAELVKPVQALLLEKLDLKTTRKIDEILRRVSLGIMHNVSVTDRDILVFCYEIIRDVYKTNDGSGPGTSEDYKRKRYLVNLKGARGGYNRGMTASHKFKMARFALDALRSVFSKHEELMTAANVAGFMPIIGDALIQGQEEVQMSAMRLLTTVIKVPLPDMDKNAKLYVAEAVKIIRESASSNTELAQAALKLVATLLRERKSAAIKELDLAYLLKKVKPDLEEPDRQGIIFNFLKAVLNRRIVIAEVYEVLDAVGQIMVTNQTRTARDLARSLYFQFIREYPRDKKRLEKELDHLEGNLKYKYVEGRISVMEAINLLVTKEDEKLVQKLVSQFFVPLVMVMINDDSSDCREMAGTLVKKLFEKADEKHVETFLLQLQKWLQTEKSLVQRTALQCWALHIEVRGIKAAEVDFLLSQIASILDSAFHREEDDWEIVYYALQAFSKLCKTVPEQAFDRTTESLWASVRSLLQYPHAWVKLSACRLLGLFFADVGQTNKATGLGSVPIAGSGGLGLLEDDILGFLRAHLRILKSVAVTEELANQVVRNLVFLSRCVAANRLSWYSSGQANGEAERENESDDTEDADSEEGEEMGNVVSEAENKPHGKSALQYLVEQVSGILRRESTTNRTPSLYPKIVSLQLLAALTNILSGETLTVLLTIIILPLRNLTDPNIPTPTSGDTGFTDGYKTLQDNSKGLMDMLQKKVGTTAYVKAMQEVSRGVKERRETRRVKRRLEAINAPEKVGRDKRRKMESKKERRREKGMEARGRRRGW